MLNREVEDTLSAAFHEAKEKRHEFITVEHLLLALLDNYEARAVLLACGANFDGIRKNLSAFIEETTPLLSDTLPDLDTQPTLGFQRVLQRAVFHVQSSGKNEVTGANVLVAIFSEQESQAVYILQQHGIERIDTVNYISHGISKSSEEEEHHGEASFDTEGAEEADDSPLGKYAVNLNVEAENGRIDPLVGRDSEVERVVQILSRRRKNNPLLVGEAGVGKTAIAEGLAKLIIEDKVPEIINDSVVYSLDLGALLAGTKYRGDFEKRLKGLLNEIKEKPEAVLFIDEIHTIIGAGASEGSMDAANILKPALARGELHTIGATTLKEYRKYFEKDTAMQRRFQPVNVDEPSVNEALQMLRGIKEKLESHHNVIINDSALVASAKLSHRYIADRFLPDKAIDLIDEAAAELKMQIESEPQALSKIKRSIQTLNVEKEALKMEKSKKNGLRIQEIEKELADANEERLALESRFENEKQTFHAASNLKAKIEELKSKAERAKRESKFEEAASIEYGEIPELEKQIEQNEQKWERMQEEGTLLRNSVDEDSIASIVSRWTGIPVNKMLSSEKQRVLQVESVLKQDVIGQDEALKAISRAIKRNKAGLSQESRPIGSFMFLGPTGVGKTESAKTLAKFLFDDQKALIRFDMSEYMEKHAVSRLIGAAPGYVGYDEGGQLTEAVRRKPYSVILFDEIEKAHPDVFNILLQVLDDGRLTDNKGVTVDFKNTIIILTSNIGSAKIIEIQDKSSREKAVMEEIKGYFKPEFLNRLDDIVIFEQLDLQAITRIVNLMFDEISKKLESKEISIELTANAQAYIAQIGFDPVYGARPLKRAMYEVIEDTLADLILEEKVHEGTRIVFDLQNGELVTHIN
jgi:ATP-dependent Clp protease ATP-binding subunit ClpB